MRFFFDYNGQAIEWEWKDKDKQFYRTYIPKKSELIIKGVDGAERQIIKDNLWENLQDEIREIKERKNQQAKESRAKKKASQS